MEIAVFFEFIGNMHGYFLLILALATNYPLPFPLSIFLEVEALTHNFFPMSPNELAQKFTWHTSTVLVTFRTILVCASDHTRFVRLLINAYFKIHASPMPTMASSPCCNICMMLEAISF